MKILDFKFKKFYRQDGSIYKYWEDIFKNYMFTVYGIDNVYLQAKNLKASYIKINKDDNEQFFNNEYPYKEDSGCLRTINPLDEIAPYKGALEISLSLGNLSSEQMKILVKSINDNGLKRDSEHYYENQEIFTFCIYGQNNCCGAISTSKTSIYPDFQNCGLGELLQYFKEDLTVYQGANLMTCTDIYYANVPDTVIGKEQNLKPYLKNTKLLLKTGWKVKDLFFNKNSNNIVGLFTKKVYRSSDDNLKVDMKIKINTNTLVKIDIDKVTLGGDPELFLKSKETGEYVPSFFVMEGDKYNPTPISSEGHNIQCDNVMVEYGIPPCKTAEEFVKHNLYVQSYINEKIAEPNNLKMIIFPSARFEEQNLLDERAKKFGCDPDYNAWDNSKPNTVGNTNTTWRCSGKNVCQAIK